MIIDEDINLHDRFLLSSTHVSVTEYNRLLLIITDDYKPV